MNGLTIKWNANKMHWKIIHLVDYYERSQLPPDLSSSHTARQMQKWETYHLAAKHVCKRMVLPSAQANGLALVGGTLETRDQEKTLLLQVCITNRSRYLISRHKHTEKKTVKTIKILDILQERKPNWPPNQGHWKQQICWCSMHAIDI